MIETLTEMMQAGELNDGEVNLAVVLCRFHDRHGRLTTAQTSAVWDILERHGRATGTRPLHVDEPTDLPDRDAASILTPQKPTMAEAIKKKSDVKFWVADGMIRSSTPFALKDLCKSVPGRSWNGGEKCWEWNAGPTAAQNLVDTFAKYAPDTDQAFRDLLGQIQAAKSIKIATDLPDIETIETTAWMHQRQGYHFVQALPGAMLAMDMGCIAGDSMISVNRGGNGRQYRIEELVTKFNGGGARRWNLDIPTMVRGLKADGSTGLVRLVAAMETGTKPTVTLVLASGRRLCCTPDHEIVTPDRWKVHAVDLRVGDLVLTDERGGRGWRQRHDQRERFGSVPARVPAPWVAGSQDGHGYVWVYEPGHPMATTSGQVLEHRKVMADHLGRLLVPGEHVHHKDHNVTNNKIENLELVTVAEHAGQHDWGKNLAGSLPVLDEVVSVESSGERPVFDLSVEDDAHTYTANGIVIGNTGKSLIGVARALDVGGNILVVCPSKVLGVWPREFRRHAKADVHIENGMRPKRGGGQKSLKVAERVEAFEQLRQCTCGRPHVCVINYEAIIHEPFQSWVQNRLWDLLLMDESHRIKAYNGAQSKLLGKIGNKKAGARLALTGTPMPHTPLDIFGQFRALDSSIFGNSFTSFRHRYAIMGGFENREFIDMNPETLGELHERFYQYAFRVKASDVLDLPPVLDDVVLTGELTGEQAKVYKSMDTEMTASFQGMTTGEMAKALVRGETVAPNVLVKMLRLRQVTGGALKDDEGDRVVIIGDLKKKLLTDWLEDLGEDEPVVVFAEFTHDLAVVREVAGKLGRPYGEVSGRHNDLTADSEYPEGVAVLGVQMKSGGSGVDLTRARLACYYSVGYSNGDYRQSRARLDRPGQTRPVQFTHLVALGTVDEDVQETLAERQESVGLVLDP